MTRLAGLVATLSLVLIFPASAQEASSATGAMLRGLDKVSGDTTDIELKNGDTVEFGTLLIALSECRFPAGDPASNAFAHLSIRSSPDQTPVFDGWMIASSPALSALDDPRYDVWVLRCSSN